VRIHGYFCRRALSIHSYSDVSPDHIKDALSAVSEKLAVYDVILGKQKLIGGNITCLPLCQTAAHVWLSLQELTLVDLFHLYYAPWFAAKGVDVMTTSGPNVARCVSFGFKDLI
jgi:hypothetical protein